jgi:hypothetical protein
MTTMNSSIRQYEQLVFQRKSLHNLKRVKLDIQTFNVLMAIDGKRSVLEIRGADAYDPTFLEEKIQLLLRLGLIEPAVRNEKKTNFGFFKRPIKNKRPPADRFGGTQTPRKAPMVLVPFIALLKAPLFWCVVGCALVAFLITNAPTMMQRSKGDATASLLPPALEQDAGQELSTQNSDIDFKTSEADEAQASSQGSGAVKSPELSAVESTLPFEGPGARQAEDSPEEVHFDFQNDDENSPADPKPAKTKWPLASLKKKPLALKLPDLTVKEINVKTRPASETDFLHYLDQAGPMSNWKAILQYASKLWRLKAPRVAKYDHFRPYLEYYNKYHKNNGLAIHSAICTLHQLKVFNMPAILEFRHPRQKVSKYLVIKKMDYQKAVLNNGKSKDDIIITHHQLDRLWTGISHIPWKKVIRSADVINTNSPPAAVKELKAYLNSVGFHNLDDPGKYNPRTALAIKKIQTRFGIAPTGVVDVVTHAAFNRYRDRMRNKAGPQRKT